MTEHRDALVQVIRLTKYFEFKSGLIRRRISQIKAVDDVSLAIHKGETFGLVGESGSGKTTLARCVAALLRPSTGHVLLDGLDVTNAGSSGFKQVHQRIQIVFQDPYASLDPRQTILSALTEPMFVHRSVSGKVEAYDRALQLVQDVGLSEDHLYRFPHEFSGGQRQRIVIARALSVNPQVLVLDEPTSLLDVSVQAQLLDLLRKLQVASNLTYLFISHNLAVVRYMSTRIGVMYLGKLVELAPTRELFHNPLHPYTQALLASIPLPSPRRRHERLLLRGEPGSNLNIPSGCRFHPRCPYAFDRCPSEDPELREVAPNHFIACHLY